MLNPHYVNNVSFSIQSNRSRRLLHQDASGEATMTVWHPLSEQDEWDGGVELTVYDCLCSKYYGGPLDTSSGTQIEYAKLFAHQTITYVITQKQS